VFEIGCVALFPELIEPIVTVGVVGRARERGLLSITHSSPRDFATDRHRTVDDRPYGGGPGMVLKFEPLRAAIGQARARLPAGVPVLIMTAEGRPFEQAWARELAAGPGLLLVAGRYEGIDQRLVEAEVADGAAELSLGDYVLSGGEPAAAVVIDAVARLLPGVLGHEASNVQDSYSAGLLDCPQYTRPEVVEGRAVPEVLLGGDHEAVRRWRLREALGRTWLRRPRLLAGRALAAEEADLLDAFKKAQER
jgi:tRNA (guanine37-N1)-methyltransferase